MPRKCPGLCGVICAVLALAQAGAAILFAQSVPANGPSPSTPFFAVPTTPAIPPEPAPVSAPGTNYAETSAPAASSGTMRAMPATQAVPAPAASPYSALLPSSDPNPAAPSLGPQSAAPSPAIGTNSYAPISLEPEKTVYFEEAWTWQLLPDSLLYKAYLAGPREPRFASQWVSEQNAGWLWDVTLGGHVGILRYGTTNSPWPEGWQFDVEGAAFPRLNLEHDRDLDAVDFLFGIPWTVRKGPWQAKFGYYHFSSHLGDELMVRENTLDRINYVRECLVLGVGFFPNPDLRLYSEAGYAFYNDGGSEPWEFQFGAEYSPAEPTTSWAAPFFAINGFLRQENDFGGNLTVQTGVQWRGHSGHLARFGLQYFNGMSNLAQFFRRHEEQIGMGLWYDY